MVSGVPAVSNTHKQNEEEESSVASASADATTTSPSPIPNEKPTSTDTKEQRQSSQTNFTAERQESSSLSARYHEHALTTPIEMVGFWTAIALPFLYVPLLITGLGTPGETMTFLALLALNVVALLAGHSYNRE